MSEPVFYFACDSEMLQLLIAALDSHRDVVLDNIETAVSDAEHSYFEGVINQVDQAVASLYEATDGR